MTYAWIHRRRVNLRPIIDRNAEIVFTEGQCVALAYEIHKLTGLPMVAIDPDCDGCFHGAVQLPDGRILDIRGVHTVEEFEKRWYGPCKPLHVYWVRQWRRNRTMMVETKHSPFFARLVLATYAPTLLPADA